MSRIRSIHPGLWTDEAFMALSAHARLLIIGIWTEAFDDGVFEWKPLTLKARIFPVDVVDVPALLDELVTGAFVRREEVDGRFVGLIRNFRHFQRPKKPNSSGLFRPEWGTYVGITTDSGEPVPNQSATDGEKSSQMEDGGGRREDEDTTPPPVPASVGARVEFEDVWEAFPHNPSSSEAKGREAFARINAADHQAVLDAAIRYSRWFAGDCEERGRTLEAGARYVPTLAKWLDGGQWREAGSLPIKGQASGPVVPMVKLDRTKDAALWLECERLAGKKAPTSDASWSFKAELVSQARSNLTTPNPTHTREAVH
jgi:hypothetical protein